MAALSILFGNFFDIPVEIYTMSYTEALQACVRSNDTRTIGKREKIKYLGLKEAPTQGRLPEEERPDPAHRQVDRGACPGDGPGSGAQALRPGAGDRLPGRKEGHQLDQFHQRDQRGPRGARREFLPTRPGARDPRGLQPHHRLGGAAWLAIDRQSDGTKASSAWNAFSSIALGRVVGRAIQAWIGQPGRPTEADLNGFAEQAARVVMGFMDNLPERYARTPAAQWKRRC